MTPVQRALTQIETVALAFECEANGRDGISPQTDVPIKASMLYNRASHLMCAIDVIRQASSLKSSQGACVAFFSEDMENEFHRAIRLHSNAFNSPHEAYAVILEEVDEFWDECKKKEVDQSAMRIELIQIAAMCLRASVDLGLEMAHVKNIEGE